MRWTELLIPTLREVPEEAEIPSHQLMLRAGLIRKLTSGVYTFLPLGLRSLRKVERIIREEMNRAGGIEVLMPALQPTEIWEQSGRYKTASEVLYHVLDRGKREWVLGPTHEEVITTLAAREISSYRQLPKNFYQIQVKFRDEIRPRFGLMRAKEFIMKDAYSFDVSDEAAQESYRRMYEAYTRIFKRCGLKSFAVEADTGVIGGKFSHEFMVPAETGENEVAYTESGSYAANIEKASSRGAATATPSTSTGAAPEKFATPGALTIEALEKAPYNVAAHAQIKTLVYIVDSKPVVILMRGDDQLNEAKFTGAVGTNQFRPATPEEIVALMGAKPGSLGAVGFGKALIYADPSLEHAKGMTTGANEDGFHLRHVDVERDIKVNHWHELRLVKAGELNVKDGEPLKIRRAIEVGHVFKLGTKYSESLGASFLDADGSRKPCVMGCYGIGVSRTLQAAIEQSFDANGIIWPLALSPFDVAIVPVNIQHAETRATVEKLAADLEAAGVEVLLDDRDERPGVKFKDGDLVGIPLRVIVGEKTLAKGQIEIKGRRSGEVRLAPVPEGAAQVLAWLADLRKETEA